MKPVNDLSNGYVEVYEKLSLGSGSYGRVYKAKCGQLPCMAKVFHDDLLKHNLKNQQEHAKKLEDDCKYFSNIKHPNLLTYLGFIRDTETRRLFLLMEAMDENLTQFLGSITGPVPQEKQIQICHDVVLGLAYLHSINIIHRNLSSNNVLLLAGKRAKVSDYGISSFANFNVIQTSMSAYMPPEALATPPRYSNKTDSFSCGVLILQIVSKLPPNPSPSYEYLEYATGKDIVPETESKRGADIDQVDTNHRLLEIARHCLSNNETKRPTANELCTSLQKLMKESENSTVHDLLQENASRKSKVGLENVDLDGSTLQMFTDKLNQLLKELNNRDEQIIQRDNHIEEMDALLLKRAEQVAAMEQQLQDKDIVISHLQKKMKKKFQGKSDTHLQPPQQQSSSLATESHNGSNTASQGKQKDTDHHITPKLYISRKHLAPPPIEWSTGQSAPRELSACRGSAVVDGNRAYLSDINNIYSYTTITNNWIRLPVCPQSYFGLVVVSEHLVAVGGMKGRRIGGEVTNTLVGLTHTKIWDDILPPMPTKRAFAAAATTSRYLVVAGGKMATGAEGMVTVESLDLENLQWSTASSLTLALGNPQLIVCKDDLYVQDAESCQVYKCSIDDITSQMTDLTNLSLSSEDTLPFKCQPPQAAIRATSAQGQNSSTWKKICSLPEKGGVRLLVEGGKILALGGYDNKLRPKGTVAVYDQESDLWRGVGKLMMPKWGFLAVSLANKRIMVVGGHVSAQQNCYSTDIASLNFEL